MIKKIGFTFVALALVGGAFFVGSNTNASFSWDTGVINDANVEMQKAGYAKKEQIVKNSNIQGEMLAAIDPKIEAEKAELNRLLEEYYQMKLDNLTDSPEFKAIEKKIEDLRQAQFNRFKTDIDALFAK